MNDNCTSTGIYLKLSDEAGTLLDLKRGASNMRNHPNFKIQKPQQESSTKHILMLLWQKLLVAILMCEMT
jgi:hypothetical protein